MSQKLIARNPDLLKLQSEGYDVEVRARHLLIKDVPYVASDKSIKLGMLVSQLDVNGDSTITPSTHVALFCGEHPCMPDGSPISAIRHASERKDLGDGLVVDHSFSAKPPSPYVDYYEKMTTYLAIITGPAQGVQPDASAKTWPAIPPGDSETVFEYVETASSRAGIGSITEKLAGQRIAIVGLGGTGSYVLDLLAKTPVAEIHLFDGDILSNHNAFRSPGAASIDELRQKPRKVEYFAAIYSKMRKRILPNFLYIDDGNVELLDKMGFVFICIDQGAARRLIVNHLIHRGIAFIDVGMGVNVVESSLVGQVRTVLCTPKKHDQATTRIPYGDDPRDNDYNQNIQIADLNALNATLAVIKWKKWAGFYTDLEHEHFSSYMIEAGILVREEQAV